MRMLINHAYLSSSSRSGHSHTHTHLRGLDTKVLKHGYSYTHVAIYANQNPSAHDAPGACRLNCGQSAASSFSLSGYLPGRLVADSLLTSTSAPDRAARNYGPLNYSFKLHLLNH